MERCSQAIMEIRRWFGSLGGQAQQLFLTENRIIGPSHKDRVQGIFVGSSSLSAPLNFRNNFPPASTVIESSPTIQYTSRHSRWPASTTILHYGSLAFFTAIEFFYLLYSSCVIEWFHASKQEVTFPI
jgi:hypothetical protein